MQQPALAVFAGLPGTGKTTLARSLAARAGATHIRIDSVEAALKHSSLDMPTTCTPPVVRAGRRGSRRSDPSPRVGLYRIGRPLARRGWHRVWKPGPGRAARPGTA